MSRRRVGAAVFTALTVLGVSTSCARTVNVSDLYTALDGDGNRKRNVFYTDSTEIHCIAEVGAGRSDATIEVVMRRIQTFDFQQGRFVDSDAISAPSEFVPSAGDGVQKFDAQLAQTDAQGNPTEGGPFVAGRYVCEARLDGDLVKTVTFNVDFPPCPDGFIAASSVCFGFYTAGTRCPKNGLLSSDPAQCTCDPVTGWGCP